jgi:hypothetical protein
MHAEGVLSEGWRCVRRYFPVRSTLLCVMGLLSIAASLAFFPDPEVLSATERGRLMALGLGLMALYGSAMVWQLIATR